MLASMFFDLVILIIGVVLMISFQRKSSA